MNQLLLALLLTGTLLAESTSPVKVFDLRADDLASPSTIHSLTPRLGWKIAGPGRAVQQSAVHILVASHPQKLADGEGDLWDSGELATHHSQLIPYEGKPLKDGQQAHWKVQIKDFKKAASPWSRPAQFQVALQKDPSPVPALFVKDAPLISSFESSDPKLGALYLAASAKLPEITSLRDIQLSLRGATYLQNIFPRANDWLVQLQAGVDDEHYYPAALPPNGTFGSTQSDTGILATHGIWRASGDLSLLKKHWSTMNRYLHARKSFDPAYSGRTFGTLPQDSLPEGDPTPESLIHLASQGLNLRIMLELCNYAADTPFEYPMLSSAQKNLQESFRKKHLNAKSELKYDSIAGQLVGLRYGLLVTPEEKKAVSTQFYRALKTKKIESAFSNGPLASHALLPVLTWTDHHDEAIELVKAQSPDALSPVALVSVSEWLIWMVAGIDASQIAHQPIRLSPYIPKKETLSFAKAHLETSHGKILSHWHYEDDGLHYDIQVPANSHGLITLPVRKEQRLTEGGKPIAVGNGILKIDRQADRAEIQVLSGNYQFQFGE